MPYKGSIPKGSRVEAELQLAASAKGAALLAISFADNGGGGGTDSVGVAPGAAVRSTVQTNPEPTGLLRVWVDFNNDSDTGHLTVRVNGDIYDTEPITGDTTWSYSLS